MTDIIRTLLEFDPLELAEKITGNNYKEDEETAFIGLGVHLAHADNKNAMLTAMDDTAFGNNSLERFLRIAFDIGFKVALELPFKGGEGENEKFYVLIHRVKGILLIFDTYGGDRANGGKYYYCYRPDKGKDSEISHLLSSRSWESEIDPKWRINIKYNGEVSRLPEDAFIMGSNDCREAMRYTISGLSMVGKFLSPWPMPQRFLWLLHYMDTKDENYDYETINRQRIEMLPQWARDIIKV